MSLEKNNLRLIKGTKGEIDPLVLLDPHSDLKVLSSSLEQLSSRALATHRVLQALQAQLDVRDLRVRMGVEGLLAYKSQLEQIIHKVHKVQKDLVDLLI